MNFDVDKKILLMKPYMPPLNEFQPYLERIWESRWLTNGGPIHKEFEDALCNYLKVEQVCLFANGTLALITALKALDLHGEVITTPFTSVATAHSILWNNLTPVFIDINKYDLNIDYKNIEKTITPQTSAILPVHVFGNPCNVDRIQEIANKYNLKVIYDAAHAFGVEFNNKSLCSYGDLSIISFHATKVFNSFEGGVIICHDENTKKRIDALKNIGLTSENELVGQGLNAKMNEFQAAFGLLQLKYIKDVIYRRKLVVLEYRKLLNNLKGIRYLNDIDFVVHNYSYFPIIVSPEDFGSTRDDLFNHLKRKNIITRKYFNPLVTDFNIYNSFKTYDLHEAKDITENILCLPLYDDISISEIHFIAMSIIEIQIQTISKRCSKI
jgi:dTDP-4-amino-4,6-dideoxygalactose transaminase